MIRRLDTILWLKTIKQLKNKVNEINKIKKNAFMLSKKFTYEKRAEKILKNLTL